MMKDNKEKKITAESLLGLFRDHFEDETGTKIDFRKHQIYWIPEIRYEGKSPEN